LARPPQRRFRIPAGRRFDQGFEIGKQRRVPRFRECRLLEIVGLRPAPGRRIRFDGSSCANSFRPRPIVLGATPVAVASAAIPPSPAANSCAPATRRRPRSSRNGATAENRSLIGSISITPTTYGIQLGCKPNILLYQKSIRLFVDAPLDRGRVEGYHRQL